MATYGVINYTNYSTYIQIDGLTTGVATTGAVSIPATIEGLPVQTIKSYAFQNYDKVTAFQLPDSITSFGIYCFNQCRALTSINIPTSMSQISVYCFSYCTSLSSLIVPDNIIALGEGAYSACSGLTYAKFHSNFADMGSSCFQGCSNLLCAEFLGNKPSFGSIDAFAYTNANFVIKYYYGKTGWFTPTLAIGDGLHYTTCVYPLSMNVNVSGVWKTSSDIKVNVGGVWKAASEVWVNSSGTWKKNS